MKTLYAQLGGEEVVDEVVALLYQKVRDDPRLSVFFQDIDMSRQERKFRMFLQVATGGPHQYSGLELRAAHAGVASRGATQEHVDWLLGHLRSAMEQLGIASSISDLVLSRVIAYSGEVLGP